MLDIPPGHHRKDRAGAGLGTTLKWAVVDIAGKGDLPLFIEGKGKNGMETPAKRCNIPYKAQIIIRWLDQDPK